MARKKKRKKAKAAPPQKKKKAKKGWYPERALERERALALGLAEKWISHQGGDRTRSEPGPGHEQIAELADVVYGGTPSYEDLVDSFRSAGQEYVPTMADYRYEVGNLAIGAHRYVRWANYGMPVYTLDPGTATMLALTDVDRLPLAEVKFPFPTFLIVVEPGAPLHIDVEGKAKEVRYVWVHHYTNRAGDPTLQIIATTADGIAVAVPFTYTASGTAGDWLRKAREPQQYGLAMTAVDLAAIERAVQLVVSLAMHMASTRSESSGPRHKFDRARTSAVGLPEPRDWIVARVAMPVEIAKAIRQRGPSLERDLTVRHVVRGHWRMQPYGEGRAQRRATWIAPFWRGEGPPALTKTTQWSDNPQQAEIKRRLLALP